MPKKTVISSIKSTVKSTVDNPTFKMVLKILGAGVLLGAVFISPKGATALIKEFNLLNDGEPDWKKFHKSRLRQTINRMVDRELVEIKEVKGITRVVLTEKGKLKQFSYQIDDMQLKKPDVWDGRWHLVMFDIPEKNKGNRERLRIKIKQLGLYQIQKSVYVTPYPCENEIAFLRQYYQVGDNVSVLIAGSLEEDDFLRKVFKVE